MLRITGVPERKREEAENLLKEIIGENFKNLEKDLDIQVHEANRSPCDHYAKRPLRYNCQKHKI